MHVILFSSLRASFHAKFIEFKSCGKAKMQDDDVKIFEVKIKMSIQEWLIGGVSGAEQLAKDCLWRGSGRCLVVDCLPLSVVRDNQIITRFR